MLNYFVIFVFAYLLAEFCLRPEYVIKEKYKKTIVYVQSFIYPIVLIAVLILYSSFKQMGLAIAIISVAHYIFKLAFRFLNTNESFFANKKTILFVSELLLHVGVIYATLYYVVNGFSGTHKDNVLKLYHFLSGTGDILSSETKVYCFLIVVVFSTAVTSVLIALITKDVIQPSMESADSEKVQALAEAETVQQQAAAGAEEGTVTEYTRELLFPPFQAFPSGSITDSEKKGTESYIKSEVDALHKLTQKEYRDFHMERTLEITEKEDGKTEVKNKISYNISRFNDSSPRVASYIGIIERFLIAVLVVKGAYTGIAFLGALKAMTRYKQFDDKGYAEKFLLGTLISALTGVICGLLIMRIFDLVAK
ncbi:DUF3307 domain-containing protein [Paenibacillus sp. MCAF20]